MYLVFNDFVFPSCCSEAARVPLLWAPGSDPTCDPEWEKLLPGVSPAHPGQRPGSGGPAGWRYPRWGLLQRGFHQWRERWVELCSASWIANSLIVWSFCVSLAKNVFRVRFLDPAHNQSHTLYVNDIYHKQQWLNCLRAAMSQQQGAPPKGQPGEAATAHRRSSSSHSVCEEETDKNCPPVSGPKLRPQTLSKTRLEQKFQGPVKRKETGV